MLELTISGFLAFLGSGLFVLGYISNNNLFPESLSAEEEKMYVKSKIKSRTSLDRQNATTLKPELGIPSQLLPILERGQKAGFLDDEYKPIPKSMTRPQQKRFALLACIEAGLDNYCNRFGKLWGCDYNGVDESRGAVYKRAAIDSLFAQDIINKAKLK